MLSFPTERLYEKIHPDPPSSLSRNANRNFSRRIHFQGQVMLERADKRRRKIVKDKLNDALRDTLEKTSN